MGQVILLSLTASLNPTLVAATTVMPLLEKPARLMLGYLLGAYMTSITLGLVIVFSLSNSSTTNTTQNTISPAVDIALGAIALAVAFVLYTGRHERLTRAPASAQSREAGQGPAAMAAGAEQGISADHVRDRSVAHPPGRLLPRRPRSDPQAQILDDATVLIVIGFNLVMLWLLEVPLASFLIAPDWTPRAIDRAKAWVSRHSTRVRRARIRHDRRAPDHQGLIGLVS